MCDFPSWIRTKEGKDYWCTDKDIELEGTVLHYLDGVGHSTIIRVHGVTGHHMEGWKEIPRGFLSDIRKGKCNEMKKTAGIVTLNIAGNKIHVVYETGSEEYYQDGKLHREDGPAWIGHTGNKEWRKHGVRHREDGPAVISTAGAKYWCLNGKYHREGGPAIKYKDGSEAWYKDGELHREDGPAVTLVYESNTRHRGFKEWFIEGKLIKREKIEC